MLFNKSFTPTKNSYVHKFNKKVDKSSNSIKQSIKYNPLAKYLLIVESPSKCAKIEQYLGQDYQCIASKGHIRELDGLKSIDSNYEITFQIIKEKSEHVQWMQTIISHFSKNNIILASDDDREGEAIAYHICDVFELPIDTTQRVIFHEITQSAIIESLKHPTRINMDIVRAQKSRQIIDILIGFKISPLLWKYIYHAKSNSLSAGRGQTPALRLIYDNQQLLSINDVGSKDIKYKITAYFFQDCKFDLNQEFSKKSDILEFLEKSKEFHHKLYLGEKRLLKSSPPKPFNTSDLLQAASNQLHYSPKQTMILAQQLYQGGYITYMRTENTKYSTEFLERMRKFIISEYGSDKYLGNFETLGILENLNTNPHEAIRVTSLYTLPDEITDQNAVSLYKLIKRHTIESCMSEYNANTYKITITAPNINNAIPHLEYNHNLEIPVFLGWKKVLSKITDNQSKLTGLLFQLQTIAKSNTSVKYNYIEGQCTIHNKHNYYTEASLIQKLEHLGIGRPSTYAQLVETIQERGYVKCQDLEGISMNCEEYKLIDKILEKRVLEKTFGKEKNKLIIQPTGILCIEFLINHFNPIFSYDYTKNMEEDLDKITTQESCIELCLKCSTEIQDLIKPVAKIEKQQYIIDANNVLVFNQYGASIKHTTLATNSEKIIEYLPVKKNMKLDLNKLKNKEYTLDDLIEFENANLGKYDDQDLYLKIGKYGNYVEWGENKKNISDIGIELKDITINDIEQFINKDSTTGFQESESQKEYSQKDHPINKLILRQLDANFSIRKGKFGNYVYYKTTKMKTPSFYKIKDFRKSTPDKLNPLTCDANIVIDWLIGTYKIE